MQQGSEDFKDSKFQGQLVFITSSRVQKECYSMLCNQILQIQANVDMEWSWEQGQWKSHCIVYVKTYTQSNINETMMILFKKPCAPLFYSGYNVSNWE